MPNILRHALAAGASNPIKRRYISEDLYPLVGTTDFSDRHPWNVPI